MELVTNADDTNINIAMIWLKWHDACTHWWQWQCQCSQKSRDRSSESVGTDIASLISKWRGREICNFVLLTIILILVLDPDPHWNILFSILLTLKIAKIILCWFYMIKNPLSVLQFFKLPWQLWWSWFRFCNDKFWQNGRTTCKANFLKMSSSVVKHFHIAARHCDDLKHFGRN